MMAYDKELRPDNRLSQNVYHGASSEGSLSPDTRSVYSKTPVLCTVFLNSLQAKNNYSKALHKCSKVYLQKYPKGQCMLILCFLN